MKWFEKFIEILKEILLWPCYLIFFFVSAILLLVSLITKFHFEQIWIFFLYSIAGSVWRYIEKDIDHGIQQIIEKEENKKICHLIVTIVYHIGNAGLLLGLFVYLKLL